MNQQYHQIGVAASRLAERLPHSVMLTLANAVIRYAKLEQRAARQAILEHLPTPDFRDAVGDFLDMWQSAAVPVGAEAVAVALVTAASGELDHRQEESVELVWTGPEPGGCCFRQTEQAILEVLNSAKQRITLVSYAVYKVPHVCEALIRAARRNVRINVILETPDRPEGENEYSTLKALGPEVAACSTVFYWPQEKRQHCGDHPGILHVKCAVADGRWLFLSSANLTEYAFTINMELGVLVTGGALPGQVEENFDRLIQMGVVEKV